MLEEKELLVGVTSDLGDMLNMGVVNMVILAV